MGRAGRAGDVSRRPVSPPVRRSAELVEQVRDVAADRATEWFPDVAGPGHTVDVTVMSDRPRSVLLEVTVARAGVASRAVAKVRREAVGQRPSHVVRPGLAPAPLPPDQQAALEWAGLCRTAEAVAAAGDPGLAAARPLAHLPELAAVVLERVDAATGRRVLAAGARLRPGAGGTRARLDQLTAHAGQWLRVCHRAFGGLGTDERDVSPGAVGQLATDLADYVADQGGPVAGRAGRAAAAVVTARPLDEVPRAVGHGDFAVRNTFLDDRGRVCVIDPMPRWRTVVLEDLARFVVSLRLQGAQVHGQGLLYPPSLLDRAERLLLEGYTGGEPVDPASWHACYLLVLLDKWAALVSQRGTGRRGRALGSWVDRYIAAEVAHAVRRAERAP